MYKRIGNNKGVGFLNSGVSAKELAKAFRVNESTLYCWVRDNKKEKLKKVFDTIDLIKEKEFYKPKDYLNKIHLEACNSMSLKSKTNRRLSLKNIGLSVWEIEQIVQ